MKSAQVRRRSKQPLRFAVCISFFMNLLLLCQKSVFAKIFESKKRKLARLHAELAKLEEERLKHLVLLFGYEFDKIGFYTATAIFVVLFTALIIQLSRSRRKWKRLAIFGGDYPSQTQSGEYRTSLSKQNITLLVAAAIFSYYVIFNLGRATQTNMNYTSKRNRGELSDVQRFVMFFGTTYKLDEKAFYFVLIVSIVILVALGYNIGIFCRKLQEKRSKHQSTTVTVNESPKDDIIDVIIVDCGLPKQSLGWFHLMQFLDMSNINVRAVVEPFYLDKAKCPYPPQSFVDLISVLQDLDVECVRSLGQLNACQRQTLFVLAGRIDKNPQYFRECIAVGATHILLEPPGAPSIGELKTMSNVADMRGVHVYMNYHRVCSPYIENAVTLSQSIPKSHIFFCHNQNYTRQDLHRVVTCHPEGMIRSMASHELAVMVKLLKMTTESVKNFKVNTNKLFSEKQTFCDKSNGKELSDFSRIAFKIVTTNGRSVSVMADRCGGIVSFAVVKSIAGKEIRKFLSPLGDDASRIEHELMHDTKTLHQFTIEFEDFKEMKRRVLACITGKENGGLMPSKSVVSIKEGIEVLRLSNYCTNEIESILK